MKIFKIVQIFGLMLFLFLISCQKKEKQLSQSSSIHVTDITGNRISLDQPAKRIVVLFEPLLDAVYMLQAQEALVGISAKLYNNKDVSDYLSLIDSRVKDRLIATPGDEESLNTESIVALDPDLVIGYNIPKSTVENLQKMGIAVYIGRSEYYQDTEKEVTDLGKLLGKENRSKELLKFASEEFKKLKENSKNIPVKTAYFSWANGQIFTTAGTESMMGQCLEFAGVKNVAVSKVDMPNINPETLVSWNPDIIYMWNDSPALFYNNPQLADITAVKSKNIYNLMPMFFYNPHNLKALLTSLRIQNWAYQLHSPEEINEQLKRYLVHLYGDENGKKLYRSIENYGNK